VDRVVAAGRFSDGVERGVVTLGERTERLEPPERLARVRRPPPVAGRDVELDRADGGGGAGRADRCCGQAEVVDAGGRDAVVVDQRPLLGPGLRGVAQALRGREHDRQRALDRAVAVVGLEPGAEVGAVELELSDAGREREAQELGDLRADLSRVGVQGVQAAQHQVERAFGRDRGGEGPSGGERVGAGEAGVAEVHAAGRAAGEHLPEGLGRGRWAHREHDDLAVRSGELDRLGVGPAAERADLELDALPHQATVLEP
jgi:hypothetical protein